jgi:hypothetical protein
VALFTARGRERCPAPAWPSPAPRLLLACFSPTSSARMIARRRGSWRDRPVRPP